MPHLPSFISSRYLFAKKSHNAINLITSISVIVVAIGSLALILILSVFNGLEDLIASLYNSITPDIEITAKQGKYINLDEFPLDKIQDMDDVIYYSAVLEDQALVKYAPGDRAERQLIINIKGVDKNYQKMNGMDSLLIDGNFLVQKNKIPFAILGAGVAGRLGINLLRYDIPLYLYFPKANASPNNPLEAFNIESVNASGVISCQQEMDDNLVLTSYEFVEKLMNREHQATSIELKCSNSESVQNVMSAVEDLLGDRFSIKDRLQQNETVYKITRNEKWSSFLILSFILLIAIFNVVGSISVLILEKKNDILTLHQMGSTPSLIRKVFLSEGVLISLLGALSGLGLGAILIVLQQQFGWIPMGGNFAVQAFPVSLRWSDFVAVFGIVLFIGFGASLLPVFRIAKTILKS